MMKKVYGSPKRQDGLYKIGRNKWELIYGYGKDSEDEETGYNYRQRFNYKPTPEECIEIICNLVNSLTDEKILRGFSWRDMPVWLSSENQFNYKSAYDLAVQTGGETLPERFKFGTDGKPLYYTFDNIDDFSDFYMSLSKYVRSVLDAGWDEKDNVRGNASLFV